MRGRGIAKDVVHPKRVAGLPHALERGGGFAHGEVAYRRVVHLGWYAEGLGPTPPHGTDLLHRHGAIGKLQIVIVMPVIVNPHIDRQPHRKLREIQHTHGRVAAVRKFPHHRLGVDIFVGGNNQYHDGPSFLNSWRPAAAPVACGRRTVRTFRTSFREGSIRGWWSLHLRPRLPAACLLRHRESSTCVGAAGASPPLRFTLAPSAAVFVGSGITVSGSVIGSVIGSLISSLKVCGRSRTWMVPMSAKRSWLPRPARCRSAQRS